MPKVAVLVGSLRRESINRKFALALSRLAAPKLDLAPVELGELPMYNDDLWSDPPAAVLRFKDEIRQADAVLFVTPEYNRSLPPVLKNAIDWGSRPKGDNAWAGKPGSIVGASPGVIGAAVAQSHLRMIAGVVDIALMGQPEVYLSIAPGLIDPDGDITVPTTRAFLENYLDRFDRWIERF
jgi:chromate reductase